MGGTWGLEQAIHVVFAMGSTRGDAKARRADRHRGRADAFSPDAALPQPLGQLQGSDALPTSSGWMGVSLAPSRQPSACAPPEPGDKASQVGTGLVGYAYQLDALAHGARLGGAYGCYAGHSGGQS